MASVGEFADDIRRYLRDEPVLRTRAITPGTACASSCCATAYPLRSPAQHSWALWRLQRWRCLRGNVAAAERDRAIALSSRNEAVGGLPQRADYRRGRLGQTSDCQ